MNWRASILAVVLLVPVARAAEARLVATNFPLAQAVLSNNCIVVCATGQIAVAWASAQTMLARPRLLDDVQRAYAASLPPGKTAGFTITPHPEATNIWHYINKDKEPSDITEVARYGPDAASGELLFRVDGERFFGNFRLVLALRARPDGPGKTNYAVDVWAYPENGVVRFFVRNLGLVERFFRKKTVEIEKIVRDVVLQINREQTAAAGTTRSAADL
ncbi:MAG: hypothetical protein NTY53_09115 [Kiritimatiellaeota bacterium]|nr:hypothetical protein [Kiritimatiellota bacterium]